MSGRHRHRTALCARACLLVLALTFPALADGPSLGAGSEPNRADVIETWPQLDHHYRNDMVEPSWRRYGDGYPYSLGEERPGDVRHRIRRERESSLDRPRDRWTCEPWRNGCRAPEPWWAR